MTGRFARVGALLLFLSLGLAPRPASADPATVPDPNATVYIDLIRDHLERYPQMNEEDAYKLLFQAVRGPGHYGMSYEPVLSWMKQEIAGMEDDTTRHQSLVEPIGPLYSRVHLAPYLAKGGRIEELAQAQVKSAKQEPDGSPLAAIWKQLGVEIAKSNFSGFELNRYNELTELLITNNWPPVHHSDVYEKAYQPHYRVLTRKEVSSLLAKMTSAAPLSE